jgi:hypothetical protein
MNMSDEVALHIATVICETADQEQSAKYLAVKHPEATKTELEERMTETRPEVVKRAAAEFKVKLAMIRRDFPVEGWLLDYHAEADRLCDAMIQSGTIDYGALAQALGLLLDKVDELGGNTTDARRATREFFKKKGAA